MSLGVFTVFVVVTHLGLLVRVVEVSGLNGLGDTDIFLESGRTVVVSVNSVLVDTDVLGLVRLRSGVYGIVIRRTETLAVLTLSDINRGSVRVMVSINLDMSVDSLVTLWPENDELTAGSQVIW